MSYSHSVIIFIVGLLISLLSAGCNSADRQEAESSDSADRDSVTLELVASGSISPLDLLLTTHEVEHRSSLMGSFVTAIDSVESSSSTYWIYTVNDTTPKVACDKMMLIAGDRLKWHLRRVASSVESDSIE